MYCQQTKLKLIQFQKHPSFSLAFMLYIEPLHATATIVYHSQRLIETGSSSMFGLTTVQSRAQGSILCRNTNLNFTDKQYINVHFSLIRNKKNLVHTDIMTV